MWAVEVVSLCRELRVRPEARHLADQLLASATSSAANYRAACRARGPDASSCRSWPSRLKRLTSPSAGSRYSSARHSSASRRLRGFSTRRSSSWPSSRHRDGRPNATTAGQRGQDPDQADRRLSIINPQSSIPNQSSMMRSTDLHFSFLSSIQFPGLSTLPLPQLGRKRIPCRSRPQNPSDDNPDEQDRRDEDEVRRRHVREVHRRRSSSRTVSAASSCSTRPTRRQRKNT